jgi:hypothetical protein
MAAEPKYSRPCPSPVVRGNPEISQRPTNHGYPAIDINQKIVTVTRIRVFSHVKMMMITITDNNNCCNCDENKRKYRKRY